MASNRYPLEDIRAKCDIVEIVSSYVALKRSGRSLKGLCPFHSEKTPSFIVNPDTQRWMCFGCGESGDVFSFLMRVEALTFPEAVEQLAAKVGVDVSRTEDELRSAGERDKVLRINSLATVYFRDLLGRSPVAQEYLKKRGISPEAVEKFKLGYASPEWRGLSDYLRSKSVKLDDAVKAGLVIVKDGGNGYYDRFRNRLMFPIQDVRDRVIAFGGRALADGDVKYINSPETTAFLKNKTIYALNHARKSISDRGVIVLVEGYMDALSAHSAGFTNIVATMGTALTPEHVKIVSRYTRSAVMAFDADSAGMSAAMRSAAMFDAAEFDVRIAAMPAGEDPDSIIRRGDRALFAELISGAVSIPDYKIKVLAGKHDLSTQAGQLALLKSAIPIIAEVPQQVDRERLIAVLAPYHPNYGSGTVPAEMIIRQEVNDRLARMDKGPVKQPVRAARRVDLVSEEQKAIFKAECELLGRILCAGLNAAEVFSKVAPEQFVSDDTRNLAAAVQEVFQKTGTLNIEMLTTGVAGQPVEKLLNELLVSTSESKETPVADLIGTIRIYRKKEQEKRFRALAEKIQQGIIKRTDKEFAEYWQLVRELHT